LRINDIEFYDNLDNIDVQYDFITIEQVLHHVKDLSILSKVVGLLNRGGYVLLKEHNCTSESIKLLIDLQHELHEIDSHSSFPVINYYSEQEWISLLESYGLIYIETYFYNMNDATNSFYALFKK
jgi:2-polyprenyl-3-methyl-5-hydroxy-6-metoxy-1,4-benzoquinol methylase